MSLIMIGNKIRDLSESPLLLLLCTLCLFLLIVLVCAAITYVIASRVNQGTAMTGLMEVGVELNVWPDDKSEKNCPKLNYGTYLVSMQDPAQIQEMRLDPHLNWFQKALRRQYAVSALLERFYRSYESAGFGDDPSCVLLYQLLDAVHFCHTLGTVSRPKSKTGLTVRGQAVCWKDPKNPDKLRLFMDVPESIADAFARSTSCNLKKICITLEYRVGK